MTRQDPFRNFCFRVEIDGVVKAGFSEVSGLEADVSVVEYREGGDSLSVHKLPGRAKYANLTLKRGYSESRDLWDWFKDILTGHLVRKQVAIVVTDEAGADKARYVLYEAWPAKYAWGPLVAKGNDVLIETLELTHEGFDLA
jgi:phage tail-like protein